MKDEICLRFKEIRLHFNVSQSGFAEKLEIKQGHVSAIEIGHNNVSTSIMHKLIEVYKININWLISGKGSMIYSGENTIDFDEDADDMIAKALGLRDMELNTEEIGEWRV